MTWQSLQARLDAQSIPLVLCGPVVRRVDRRSVTVWVATSQDCTIEMDVEQLGDGFPGFSGQARTMSFGRSIWIATIRATSGVDLPWQTPFAYDLTFTPSGQAARSFEAALAPGTGLASLTYSDFGLPTFVTPARAARDLRILHGSCRKPHGPGGDALTLVDRCLEERANDFAMRPCQLYLTGDQIYADDVADVLLFLLQDAATALLGNEEILPGVAADDPALAPGHRADLSVRAGMTSGLITRNFAKSHLMTFGEYLLMYLLSWSDVLWPADSADAWPDAARVGVAEKTFVGELASIRSFRAGLKKVRRVLANIATYMIFDDHDVTDDWNISRDWARAVYGGTGFAEGTPLGRLAHDAGPPIADLGRRIVTNALSAYAVCQAWGNDPTSFAGGNGADLLDTVSRWARGQAAAVASAESLLLPPREEPVAGASLGQPANVVAWWFVLSLAECDWEAAFLDCRTLRTWLGAEDDERRLTPSAPVSQARLLDQLSIAGRPYLVVICPAPVFGIRVVEWVQEMLADNVCDRRSLSGAYDQDYESWSASPAALHFLLLSLAEAASPGQVPPRVVVLLSGDVHHGFSFRLRYRRSDHAAAGVVFVQYTSSPLKNRATLARVLRLLERLAADPVGLRVFSWRTGAGAIGGVFDAEYVLPGDLPPPTWRGRLQALKDSRTDVLVDPIGYAVRSVAEAVGATKFLATDKNRIVVDPNHFAELYFGVSGDGEVVAAVQGLYVDGAEVGRAAGTLIQTQHVASLDADLPEGED